MSTDRYKEKLQNRSGSTRYQIAHKNNVTIVIKLTARFSCRVTQFMQTSGKMWQGHNERPHAHTECRQCQKSRLVSHGSIYCDGDDEDAS